MDWHMVATAFLYIVCAFLLVKVYQVYAWVIRHKDEHARADLTENMARDIEKTGQENLMELDAKVKKLVGPVRTLNLKKRR